GGIIGTSTADRWKKQFTALTGTNTEGYLGGPQLSDEGQQAIIDFERFLLDWEERNPNASAIDREKAINEAGKVIRERIESDGISGGQYISPAEKAARERAQADQPAPQETSPAETLETPAEVVPEEQGGGSWYDYLPNPIRSAIDLGRSIMGEEPAQAAPEAEQPQSTAPALETLSEPRRAAVEALAKRHGVTPEEANQLLHQRLQKLMPAEDPGVDPTITNSIPEETRSNLENLL
ncbi:hypothetical protein AB4144_37955, partial [Rhizobiaceae sp. 2RAB30]